MHLRKGVFRLCGLGFGVALISASAQAGSDLMIHPTRITIAQNKRSAMIDLTNTGSEVASYRISLENKRMTPTGEFVPAPTPLSGETFADHLIQFSPRQVDLAPGSGQTVRILVKRPADLAPGEYRTHLVFSRLPSPSSNSVETKSTTSGNELGIHLKALIGVSIPIIVFQGEPTVATTLSDLKLLPAAQGGASQLQLKLNRSGNKSLYGDLSVTWVSKDGSETPLGEARGIAVYYPNPFRITKVTLRPQDHALAKGRIRVTFSETRDAGGRQMADGSLEIP